MTKGVKIILIILSSLLTVALSLVFTYFAITDDAKLDVQKFIDFGNNAAIYDDFGNQIENTSLSAKRKTVKIEELDPLTVKAFIASEDRTFYKHNGLNYKRMIKALYKNVVSGSFKEGASTISQQLIKNTHLSSDKTIKRKLKEIRLTRQLEKKYDKDEILEMYFNTIYFGHNCYGLQSAANFYFGKNASELTLEQSATIVGLLTSPNNYSPFKNAEKSLQRRNIVLKNMADCGFIDENAYIFAKNQPLSAQKTDGGGSFEYYFSAVLDELEDINFDFYSIADGCNIYTHFDGKMQQTIENLEFDCDNSVVITNKNGGVCAYKSTVNNAKRQPGSTIKPLLVYAPAIEEKKVHTFTKIKDEPINFNGYSPENYDGKYHGFVTVSDCLKNSYNVPSVKLLNTLTLPTAEGYAKRMDIKLDGDEKNLSLALGGMKYGLNLKEICDRYSIFQRGGRFTPSKFIKKITDKNGRTLYEAENFEKQVFSQGTCTLMNGMLIDTAKSGTARKLKNFDFDVAAKTGTCGTKEGNTDAYAICYTSEHCLGVWLGDKNNKKLSVTGGGSCCNYAVELLENLYDDKKPGKLDTVSGTQSLTLDREEYDTNNKIVIADELSPLLNKLKVRCLSGNLPVETSDRFSNPKIKKPSIIVKNNIVSIELCQTKYYSYLINRLTNGKKTIIYDDKWTKELIDTPPNGMHVYTVIPYYFDGVTKHYGEEIELGHIMISSSNKNETPPDIVYKDWYNI